MYTHVPSFKFPSRLGHYRAISSVPCAIQRVLINCFININVWEFRVFLMPDSRWESFLLSLFNCSRYLHSTSWQPTPVFLPGESHEWRSLVG